MNKKVLSRLSTNQRISKKDLMCADLSVISAATKVSTEYRQDIVSTTVFPLSFSVYQHVFVRFLHGSCKGCVRAACFPPLGGVLAIAPLQLGATSMFPNP